MSQVIGLNDSLRKARLLTKDQEDRISRDGDIAKWRMNDITKPSPVMKVLGMIALPIVAFWGVLMVGVGFAMSFVVFLLKLLGKIFR